MFKNKVKKRYEIILISFLMSAIMAGLMSIVITYLNLGLVDDFVSIWFQAYWRAFVIAFPIVLTIHLMCENLLLI